MQKTLGGDRLGAGKKMKIDLHGYERSTHDLSYLWRSTMSAGTLVPFLTEIALPGDTFDIRLNANIKTHPTIGPLFGSYKVQLDIFQAPIRLYNALLHNNKLGIGMDMSQVKLPQIELTALPDASVPGNEDIDNSQINPSSLLSYLGIRGIGRTPTTPQPRQFNALPLLAYWDIYKNYYSNKQEEIGAVIHTPSLVLIQTIDDIGLIHNGVTTIIPFLPASGSLTINAGDQIEINYTGAAPLPEQLIFNTIEHGPISGTEIVHQWLTAGPPKVGTYNNTRWGAQITVLNWQYVTDQDIQQGRPKIATFNLAFIDDMREAILAFQSMAAPLIIGQGTADMQPYIWLVEQPNGIPNILSSQEGLALKTYQSDLFNNWLQTEWIDGAGGITQVTAIDTTSGAFTLDTLNLAKKVYDMLNRIAVSGGTYDDWLDAVYTHDRYQRCETPMYMGGLSKELVFQEVVSNSQTTEQPLGTLAGKGVMTDKHKGGQVTIKVDEPSYILGIISLTPRIDYSQGNKWDTHLATMNDLHKPALDEIGFQELITEQLAWWDTAYDDGTDEWTTQSAGKQPAWINYMTNVNQTRGNFAINTNEMFMTLNRRYEQNGAGGGILDLTTYIDPSKFNFIFAQTALDAQNFWAQISVDIEARRKMSAKLMPNL